MAGTKSDNLIKTAFPNAQVGQTFTIGGESVTYQGSDIPAPTPEKLTYPKDARENAASHDPKNTQVTSTRSGHSFEMNDNAGAEHITMQHRSGSMVQFQPDGSIMVTAHNGQYTAVFGTNQLYITGTYDVVVDGSASMKVKGDYNVTVDGNYNLTVSKDMNQVINGNFNNTILTDLVLTVGGKSTNKTAGNLEITAEQMIYIGAHGGLGLFSTDADINIHADATIAVSSGTSTAIAAGTKLTQTSVSGMKLIDPSGIDLNP
jgi:hypothetical protein